MVCLFTASNSEETCSDYNDINDEKLHEFVLFTRSGALFYIGFNNRIKMFQCNINCSNFLHLSVCISTHHMVIFQQNLEVL